ncbi:E3 ubiquitin/ISG15 ligase TRIM25-like [Alosa sapidissima]|uniref:E3 ubiquitin/ISG15 ligase TRIM25-like n=1 Tax=Alosa sapidissima TaxID=34773 RepID=UPI001C080AA9|nr:E3 ubiquitin/ISG15 ligase TRIM25-like [Alosa sapidissima]
MTWMIVMAPEKKKTAGVAVANFYPRGGFDPVTVPCGHSFCLNCIKGCWNQEDQKGVYSCPQCRETFTPRPVLRRNTIMANVMEKLKAADLTVAKASCYTGPDDVECDFCTGRKHKAIKSCLTCMVSYCEVHIQPHYEVPGLSRHQLVNATLHLQEKICSRHNRIIEVFCRTDQKLICLLCLMENHNGHETVSAVAEQTHKQNLLLQMKECNQWHVLQKEKDMEEVKQALVSLQASARTAVEDMDTIFTQLISFMEQKCFEGKVLIRAQERAEVSRSEGLLEQLELEITKLKSIDAEMKKLQPTEDPIDFLQRFQSLISSPPVAETVPKVTFEPRFSFCEVMKLVSPALKEKTKEFHQAIHNVTGFMKGDRVKLKAPEDVRMGNSGCRVLDYVTVRSEGVIRYIRESDVTVDFLEVPAWNGNVSKINLVL